LRAAIRISIRHATKKHMKNKLYVALQLALIAVAGHFIAYQICHIPKQMELVVLLGIALAYPVLRFPIVGVYAIFLISPFIPFVRRLYYLVYARPGMDPLIVVGDIITLLVFVGLFFELREPRSDGSFPKTFIRIVAFYIVYLVLRTFAFNISPLSESIGKLKYYAPPVFLFFIGVIYAREPAHLKRLWTLTVAIGIAACFYGFKQLYIGYSDAERLWFSSVNFTTLFIKGIARPFSFFQAPAAFADYLQLSIVGVLMLMAWGNNKGKPALALLIPLFVYGILVTSVRSNWIGAVAALFFWFVVLPIKKKGHRAGIIIAAVALFMASQFIDDSLKSNLSFEGTDSFLAGKLGKKDYIDLMVTSRAKAITNPFEEHSMLSRLALWKYMFILTYDPQMAILGRGLGTLNADSLYVTYLAEFGYPGFIFIIALLCAFIVRGMNAMNAMSDPRAAVLAKGIVCMDMSFALMNLTGTHIHAFPGDVYFWFWNGVLVNIAILDKKLTGGPAAP
jgi:putative inorganic carbon (hco3(-)) transporter